MQAAHVASPGLGWPHRPVGRVLITMAIALVAAPALVLDAAAPADEGGLASLVAWHALSTLVLAGLAAWGLWTQQLPRPTGRALAGLLGLLLLGALALAARRLPGEAALNTFDTLLPAVTLAAVLSIVGWRWARREILW
jgi:hypothetical protein